MKKKFESICRFLLVMNIAVFVLLASPVFGVQDEDKSEDDKKTKIATEKVKEKPIRFYQTFDGRFEATQRSEVKTDFKNWTDFEIKSIVEEGSAVSAGQDVVVFDTDSIDKAISEAEFAFHSAEFATDDARLALKEATETFELEKAKIEATWKHAQEDYEYYKNETVPQREKDTEYDEKTAGYSVEYSKDELDQLEQMYTEDELTEESEEIVLKRARRSLESSERRLERTLRRIKRNKETVFPRSDVEQDNSFKQAKMAYETAKVRLAIGKSRKEVALAKAEFDLANKKKKLDELVADRERMTLKAPSNGIVYYGKSKRGKWVGVSGVSVRRIEVGKKIPAKKVVMTIVSPGQMMIRSDLNESQLDLLAVRTKGVAQLKSFGNAQIPVMVKSVSRLPMDSGKFDCQLTADLDNIDVMPGMTCKVSLLVYENDKALVVSKSRVFSDDDGINNYVFLVKDDEATMTPVKLGRSSGDMVEILEGLSVGDEIAKSRQ